MRRLVALFMLLIVTITCAATISNSTGIVATDIYGRSYDIDGLLDAGKHIIIHQTFSG